MSIQIQLQYTETLQSKGGNRDLSYCLNWALFLTVVMWLFGIMFFVVLSDSKLNINVITYAYSRTIKK